PGLPPSKTRAARPNYAPGLALGGSQGLSRMVNVRIASNRPRRPSVTRRGRGPWRRPPSRPRPAPGAGWRRRRPNPQDTGRGARGGWPWGGGGGGGGPADAGMLWIDGIAATVPTSADYAQASPYVLRAEDDGWGVYRDGERLAGAQPFQRPRYYDLETADGIPYWKIALLHLDSLASTVIQTCAYWGNSDQCAFCGIGVTLANGRTIAKKTPAMLAEVAVAARDLDGAVDATLTTGTTATPDKGAL